MLQYQLTGVRFVLTVIDINVELIRLENRRGKETHLFYSNPQSFIRKRTGVSGVYNNITGGLTQVTKQ